VTTGSLFYYLFDVVGIQNMIPTGNILKPVMDALTSTYTMTSNLGATPASWFTNLLQKIMGYVPGGEGTIYALGSIIGVFIVLATLALIWIFIL
jgi:hypothetical protein